MTNTNILCPDCMKGRIETEDEVNGVCNNCGMEYTITGPNRVKYGRTEVPTKKHVSIQAFVSRPLVRVSDEKWKEYDSYLFVDFDDAAWNDPKYNWIMCVPDSARDTKYSRTMVSEEYKLRRGQTMGEFYGTSTID